MATETPSGIALDDEAADPEAPPDMEDALIVAGSASRKLGADIAARLGLPVAAGEVIRFSEGNLFVRVMENVRGRHVYLVQGTVFPANDRFMELLFWIDALKRASAASVTAVIPYFSYAKGDKKDEPRVSIRARVCADAIEAAGADRVVTMDLHAPQVQGFFHVPVDDLYALPVLCDAIDGAGLGSVTVVAPDAGFAKKAQRFARRLHDAPTAVANKQRADHSERAEILSVMGDVRGRTALLVDDFVISGGTLAEAAHALRRLGAAAVHAAITHGVFTPRSVETLDASPIERLFVTDTVETDPPVRPACAEIVSVAPLFAEAIRRIHHRDSISVLFD
jgi:ribose-phosphate pyrophosphokinase